MTVKELIEALQECDESADILLVVKGISIELMGYLDKIDSEYQGFVYLEGDCE